jgi:hypothetical protein
MYTNVSEDFAASISRVAFGPDSGSTLQCSNSENHEFFLDDVDLLGRNISTKKRNTEVLLGVSTDINLEVISEKTRHMFMFYYQNVGQNQNIKDC